MARHGLGVVRRSLCVGVVVGCVVVGGAAVPAGAAVSDDDCTVLMSAENWDQSTADSNSESLAATAASMRSTADDIEDGALQKGLRKMASVYQASSRANSVQAAGIVFSKKAKKWASGYTVYAKALTDCQMKAIEDLP